MSARSGSRFADRLRITPGALLVIGLEIGLSLVWLMSGPEARARMIEYLVATPTNVFEHGRVWTLATSVFLEDQFIGLLLHAIVMWSFVPTLERFWGTKRFFRFVAITSIVGTLAGVSFGYVTGRPFPINGLDPFIWASIIAFGIIYARQPVQFWGVLPLTGRQLMYGFLVFLALFIGLQQAWELGAAFAAAMIAAAILVSKRWSPGLAWKKWRLKRARAKLSVIEGGVKGGGGPKKKSPRRDEHKWLN